MIQNLKDKSESPAELQHEISDTASEISGLSDNDTEDQDDESLILMKSDDESIITVDSKISTKTPAWEDDDDEDLS